MAVAVLEPAVEEDQLDLDASGRDVKPARELLEQVARREINLRLLGDHHLQAIIACYVGCCLQAILL